MGFKPELEYHIKNFSPDDFPHRMRGAERLGAGVRQNMAFLGRSFELELGDGVLLLSEKI